MKAIDLKVGSRVKAHYFNGCAVVIEKTEKQITFKIEENEARRSNLGYNLKNKIKRISIVNVQKMIDWEDEFKLEILN